MNPGILQLVDSLAVGGTETVAVNLANALPGERFRSYLCATRAEGPLRGRLQAEVGYLFLARRSTLDLGAIRRLRACVRQQKIAVVHAHSTSLFLAVMAGLSGGFPPIVWHDHFGRSYSVRRSWLPYWLLTRRVRGVIAVNRTLVDWTAQVLHVPASAVWQIPNFVVSSVNAPVPVALAGTNGFRTVCLGNLRPQKNHTVLLQAFKQVHDTLPQARLFLAGAPIDTTYTQALHERVAQLGLAGAVEFLGVRQDVRELLAACDVGVLSSDSEGFPLALLDYGNAGLAAIATDVGQCREILAAGGAGLVVPPRDPHALATALLRLLRQPDERRTLSEKLRDHIRGHYSPEAVMRQVTAVYDRVLSQRVAGASSCV